MNKLLSLIFIGSLSGFIGGLLGGEYKKCSWLINTIDNSLTRKNDMNYGRDNFAIAYDVQKKEIYACGGYNGNELKNCEKYSIESDLWTEIAPL